VEAATVAWPNGVDISPESLYDAQDLRDKERKGSGRSRGKTKRR
jgi:hypothetical protein